MMVRGMTNDAPLTRRKLASLISRNGARRGFASVARPMRTANRVLAISRKQRDTSVVVALVTR